MIRKLFLSLLLLVLFGCSNDSFPLMQDEAEGSVTKFNNDTHGTYGSTYVPLSSENAVIRNATVFDGLGNMFKNCLLYTSPSPRDQRGSRMPSSA